MGEVIFSIKIACRKSLAWSEHPFHWG